MATKSPMQRLLLLEQEVAQLLQIGTGGGGSAPPTVTLAGIALSGPANVSEGTSATYQVRGSYSDGHTAPLTSGVAWSSNAPGGVLSIAADAIYGNSRTVTVVATAGGYTVQRVVQVLDATTAPDAGGSPTGRRQTVGIFDVATNTLVAQPVIDEAYTADKIKWDGLDIRGKATDPSRRYQARPISNAANLSVATTWQGVLANNSDSFTGAGVWGSDRPTCFNFRGGRGRYGPGYIERSPNYSWFEVGTPGARVLNPNHKSSFHSVGAICSDAARTYRSGVAFSQIANPATGKTNTGNYVTATNNSDESDYTFPNGESFLTEEGIPASALDVSGEVFAAIGIAVQQSGRLLLHLHPDRVVFFDKAQGGPALGQVALSNPAGIELQNDTTVAIVHDGKVELFTLDPAALTLTSLRIVPVPAGFVPRKIAFSPVAPTLSVLCGGLEAQLTSTAQHRIFHFNTSNYDAAPRVEGSGDLALNPLVSDDTFCFYDAVKFTPGNAWIAYQEDGSYWFDDEGNKRSQHRAADGTLLYTRYCAGTTYAPTVNATDASKVYDNYLEYEVDHSKPKTPANTNGWWKLKYNRACFRNAAYEGAPSALTTTSNGYVLGFIRNGYSWIIVEYTTTGALYFPQLNTDLTSALDRNGDIIEVEGFYNGNTKTIYRRPLTGYSGGAPTYGPRVTEGSALLLADTPNSTGQQCGPTTDGTYGCFCLGDTRFHLGGIQRGATAFRFETAESTWPNYQGPFPAKGQYDVGNGVWYQGSFLLSIDNYFIWACRGERWKNGQVVKFIITTSDGRYIGQFGTVRDGAFQSLLEPAAAGQGGNAITGQVVKVGSKYVLMHGDENQHGGIQVWEFDLSTVREEAPYDIVASALDPLPGTDLMGVIPFDNLGFGSGSAIGNWKLMGGRAETSRDSRTSIKFILNGGDRAYAPFPAGAGAGGYVVAGYYAWHELGGYNSFYYPLAGLEFKDANGVTFLRLAHIANGANNSDAGDGTVSNTANGVVITTGVALVAAQETAELRPFRLRVTAGGKLFFSYNGRAEQEIPVFSDKDNLNANPLQPGTVEINFTAYGNGDLKFSVDQLRLLPAS